MPDEKTTLWQTTRAVLSAFIGIRRAEAHQAANLTPGRVIAVGLICAALFVLTLAAIVSFIV